VIFRIFIGIVIIVTALFLYQIYGYRYVLEHVRSHASAGMTLGSEDAPYNILAYIDYGSDWSRRIQPVLLQTLSRNPEVNVVIKPLAGVSENSELAARIALSALQDNKFLDIHSVLMQAPRLTEDYIQKTVASQGLDYRVLLDRAYDEVVTDMVNDIKREALLLNIQSTPHIYVEDISLEGGGHRVEEMDKIIRDLKYGRR
jgi:protein-disulfide isomerase